jgi:hypothetical protein
MFVSMDVTFRESVPFYGEKMDLSSLFRDLDSQDTIGGDEEVESGGEPQVSEKRVVDGLISNPVVVNDVYRRGENKNPLQREICEYIQEGEKVPCSPSLLLMKLKAVKMIKFTWVIMRVNNYLSQGEI